MAAWLRLPSGMFVNMERVITVYGSGEDAPPDELWFRTADGDALKLRGADGEAMRAYLERVHVGERTADEKPPRGRDNFIRKT